MTSSLIKPTFLITYSRPAQYNDYRCVVNSTGTTAIFERCASGTPNSQSILYSLDLSGSGNVPAPFLTGTSAPLYSGRPDWCWDNGNVAFNCVPEANGKTVIGYTTDGGADTSLISSTKQMIYPTWFPPIENQTQALAVMNCASGPPIPNTSVINLDGDLQSSAVAGSTLWAGMPSVNQAATNLIACAGQIIQDKGGYNQDLNYIWLVDTSTNSTAPLESGCPSWGPFTPQFQGRSPWWSPDGNWIAFESNRAHQPTADNPSGLYAIFLYEVNGSNPAIQITDPIYNANHAKWFPSGTELIVAAYQPGDDKSQPPAFPWGLASLDVSSIVGSSTR